MEAGVSGESDVLIVAGGKWAYHCLHRYGAYICQAGRSFRPEACRIGYYANGAIQREFPSIQARRDHVSETREVVHAWLTSGDAEDARFAAVVALLLLNGREEGGRSQIFLLSPPQSPETLLISRPIRNTRPGHGSAWTQGHRYASEAAIRHEPETTEALAALLSRER